MRSTPVGKLVAAAAAFASCTFLAFAGCGSTGTSGNGGLQIVAAENFWGSIARQLAGTKASVRSIIVDPAQDPHSYEPTANDARMMASARVAIVNGVGYDSWASKLLAANPASSRNAIDVGGLLGLHEGDNPHSWYSPADVERVALAITATLRRLAPNDARYFDSRLADFDQRRLAQYHSLVAQIRRTYGGTPVGASESIFTPLAAALGLRVLTPASFTKAISEGTEVSAQDKLATEREVSARQIRVWVYNSQNATPEIQHLNALARAAAVPIVAVSESVTPPGATFEQWQAQQLRRLALALQHSAHR